MYNVPQEQERAQVIRHQAGDVLSPHSLGMVDRLEGVNKCAEQYFVMGWMVDEYNAGYVEAMTDADVPAIYSSDGFNPLKGAIK